MSLWTALVAIVAITFAFDFLKQVVTQKKGEGRVNDQLAQKDEKIRELEGALIASQAENAELKTALEEQRILADEAISSFGSRFDKLRGRRREPGTSTEEGREEE